MLGDSMWSIFGLVFMNVVVQFIVYPYWNKVLGSEQYGDIVYMLSMMNIAAVTFGSAGSYARISLSSEGKTSNTPYLVILTLAGAVTSLYALVVCLIKNEAMSFTDILCYILLTLLTMWRFYADIEFKLSLNYKCFFLYYVLIGIGYALGMLLMNAAQIWPLTLIPGEIFGLLFVYLKGSIFKAEPTIDREETKKLLKLFMVLSGSYFINNLIFNGDRILLKLAVGNTAVSVFYLASLFGKTMSFITTPFSGVISGYLARSKTALTYRTMHMIAAASVVISFVFSGLCTAGSYILLPFLYPDLFHEAKGIFFLCNLSQVFYFVSGILGVIILMYSKSKYQIYINIVYAAAFLLICLPITIYKGLEGYCSGILVTSIILLAYCISLGYYTVYKNKQNAK